MKKEKWKPIIGYEGEYEVSSLGRVKSIGRVVQGGEPIRALLDEEGRKNYGAIHYKEWL